MLLVFWEISGFMSHNETTLEALEIRPATQADEAFANDLLFRTMHEYVEATLVSFRRQEYYYRINSFDASKTWIIQCSKNDIGRLTKTVIEGDCVFIDEIHILSEYQRMGIGRRIIERVIAEAQKLGLPVKLTVLKVNCAQNLYLRMGFNVTAEKNNRLHMERRLSHSKAFGA